MTEPGGRKRQRGEIGHTVAKMLRRIRNNDL
jgi:hypothetical protein